MFNTRTASSRQHAGAGKDVRSALFCMALIARMTGRRLDSGLLVHQYGHLPRLGRPALIRVLRDLGIKARAVPINRSTVRKLPLPAIVTLKDGTYAVLQSIDGNTVQLHRFDDTSARSMSSKDFRTLASGWAIPVRSASAPSVTPSSKPAAFGLGWFLRTLFKYGSVMREALLASVMVQFFALVSPIVFMLVIDKVFSHNNLSTLDVLVFALAVVSLFDVLLGGIRTYLMTHTGNRVDVELGMRLFRHLMRVPLSYFESRTSGDTIARIRELETVRQFLTGSTLNLFVDLVFTVLFLVVMYLFSPVLAGIVLASLPLFFLVSFVVTPLMRGRLEDRHRLAAENQSFLVETLGGIETVKAGAMEPIHQRAWEERLAAYAGSAVASSNLSNLVNQIVSLLSKALTVGLLYIGAKLVLAGELSVGQLIAFNMLSARVVAPVQRLAQLWQELTSTRISMRRLADIMDAPVEPASEEARTATARLEGRVRFDRVGFRYDDSRPPVLTDVSFEVGPGELVGIIGPTGAGKTTLVKLLQRLYAPTSGTVSIDGINLYAMNPAWLRRQIGVVSQDYVLFNRSIRDNITLGNPEIEDQAVIAAAELCGAHALVTSLPEGYDTVLSERGRGLSSGQRQAIALARAIVSDPAILILDEATSAFDYETEQRFQDNFASIRRGRTTFVVAHRLSTVRNADRILTLEDGHLVENAGPSTLIEAGGRFARLKALHELGPGAGREVAGAAS